LIEQTTVTKVLFTNTADLISSERAVQFAEGQSKTLQPCVLNSQCLALTLVDALKHEVPACQFSAASRLPENIESEYFRPKSGHSEILTK